MVGRSGLRPRAPPSAVNGNALHMADIDISNALDVDTSDVQATVTSISSGKRPVNLAASSAGPATKKRKAASLIIGDGDDKVSGDDALGPMSDNDKDSAGDSEASKKDQPALATKADDRRPPPRGMPAVWAKTRGDLAETVDYFRCRQGGLQSNDGQIKGLLMAEDNSKRPYMDGELILTRSGGGNDIINGKVSQSKDQNPESVTVLAFRNNVKYEVPAVVILSDRCLHSMIKPPYPYSVMGHFKPIFCWYEKNNARITVRFRWERLHLDGKSWWVSKDSPTRSGPPDYDTKAQRQVCPTCHLTHPRIYEEGFICVNYKCNDFWKLNGMAISNNAELTYNREWLTERTKWTNPIRPPYALRPKALPEGDTEDPFYYTTRAAMKGIVCPQCGSCISRKTFGGWYCNTSGCDYVRLLPRMTINIRTIELAYGAQFQGYPMPHHTFEEPVARRETIYHGPWRVETIDVLEGCFVKQFHSNELINGRPGGANDMFQQMTDPVLELARRPMNQSKVSDTLTGNFSHNFGMKYKYSATVPTKPFSDSPEVIRESLNKMTWINDTSSEDVSPQPLNEVLVLGYLEDQLIHWHDDGEDFLGPTIVTFSLGCIAKMEIRMKGRYFYGAKSNKLDNYDPNQPIVDGCLLPERRRQMNEIWGSLSEEDRKKQFKEFKALGKCKKHGAVIFHTKLHHGDYIVMHGHGLQRYFEHQISNLGDIRFAITGRHVKPETIPEKERNWGDCDIAPEMKYTGDMDAFDDEEED